MIVFRYPFRILVLLWFVLPLFAPTENRLLISALSCDQVLPPYSKKQVLNGVPCGLPNMANRPCVEQLERLVTVERGTLPIVLSVPHGGHEAIPGAAERRGVGLSDFQTVRDTWTIELATACANELQRAMRAKPYMVLARFDRKYVDVNRPPQRAYEGEAGCVVYEHYHRALEEACQQVRRKWGGGLLLDLHGQGEYPDAICRGTLNGRSVRLLLDRHGWAALTGKRGVFGYLQRLGYKVLPDCLGDPTVREVPAYQGGYIVAAHGSHTDNGLDAVQVEIGLRLRQKGRWQETARDLAAALSVWVEEYYPSIR